MNICYFCHSLNPKTGIGHWVLGIIDQLKNNDPEFRATAITSEGLLPWGNKFKLILNLPAIYKIARQAETIHAFDIYPYGIMAMAVGRLARRPVVLTLVGTGSVQKLDKRPYFWLMRLACRRARKITAISSYVKKLVNEKIPNLDIQVINPGIDNDFWGQNGGRLLVELAGKDYLLSVGTFKARKGYEQSIRIFKQLSGRHPDLYYAIIGRADGKNPYFRKIKELIADKGLNNRVIILDNLTDEELRAAYHQAKMFWLLSREDQGGVEGFGLVFLEAAAAGVPVLGSQNSGAADAVDDGVNGYLINPDSKDVICSKIEQVLTDAELHSRLAAGSWVWAQKKDWRNVINDYLKIYAQI